jgi:LysR family transcriptional activator of glutamate synthase operon
MNLQQLKTFEAAARHQSFTQGSEFLQVSQSTVSQHIKQLEDELGCALFLRAGKRVHLSEAGQVLLTSTERIFHELKDAEACVREIGDVKRGTARLGVGATTLTYQLPHVLEEYKRRYPEVELVVTTGTTESLLVGMHSQALDVAILMDLHRPPNSLMVTPLRAEELVVIMSKNCSLASQALLDPADLASVPFILYHAHGAMQITIDSYLDAMGIHPQVLVTMENIEAIKSLVEIGVGVSIVPLSSVANIHSDSPLKVARIEGHKMVRRLSLITFDVDVLPAVVEKLSALIIRFLADPRRTEIWQEHPC